MNELISIIMPSYNTAAFIADSIKSVLKQTYTNWELIIVDDCSTDNTDEVVSSFDDSRIKFFKNDKNSGAAASRNKALKEASGDYVAFLDSDDLWLPSKLEKQLTFMKNNMFYFSYTCYERMDENGNKLNILCSGPKIITKRKMYHYCYPGCLTVMYKRNELKDLQIVDIKKNNDYAIWLIVSKLYNCYLLNENLAIYRVRKRSVSHDRLSRKIKSHYELFRRCDGRKALTSLWLAFWNMIFGFLKTIIYTRRIK